MAGVSVFLALLLCVLSSTSGSKVSDYIDWDVEDWLDELDNEELIASEKGSVRDISRWRNLLAGDNVTCDGFDGVDLGDIEESCCNATRVVLSQLFIDTGYSANVTECYGIAITGGECANINGTDYYPSNSTSIAASGILCEDEAACAASVVSAAASLSGTKNALVQSELSMQYDACPLSCRGAWGDWGECESVGGECLRFSSYSVSSNAVNGGASCAASHGANRNETCGGDACGPVMMDCPLLPDAVGFGSQEENCCFALGTVTTRGIFAAGLGSSFPVCMPHIEALGGCNATSPYGTNYPSDAAIAAAYNILCMEGGNGACGQAGLAGLLSTKDSYTMNTMIYGISDPNQNGQYESCEAMLNPPVNCEVLPGLLGYGELDTDCCRSIQLIASKGLLEHPDYKAAIGSCYSHSSLGGCDADSEYGPNYPTQSGLYLSLNEICIANEGSCGRNAILGLMDTPGYVQNGAFRLAADGDGDGQYDICESPLLNPPVDCEMIPTLLSFGTIDQECCDASKILASRGFLGNAATAPMVTSCFTPDDENWGGCNSTHPLGPYFPADAAVDAAYAVICGNEGACGIQSMVGMNSTKDSYEHNAFYISLAGNEEDGYNSCLTVEVEDCDILDYDIADGACTDCAGNYLDGHCSAANCIDGYADKNGFLHDGCEYDCSSFAPDDFNGVCALCGAIDTVVSCTKLASCSNGYKSADGDHNNGCEAAAKKVGTHVKAKLDFSVEVDLGESTVDEYVNTDAFRQVTQSGIAGAAGVNAANVWINSISGTTTSTRRSLIISGSSSEYRRLASLSVETDYSVLVDSGTSVDSLTTTLEAASDFSTSFTSSFTTAAASSGDTALANASVSEIAVTGIETEITYDCSIYPLSNATCASCSDSACIALICDVGDFENTDSLVSTGCAVPAEEDEEEEEQEEDQEEEEEQEQQEEQGQGDEEEEEEEEEDQVGGGCHSVFSNGLLSLLLIGAMSG